MTCFARVVTDSTEAYLVLAVLLNMCLRDLGCDRERVSKSCILITKASRPWTPP